MAFTHDIVAHDQLRAGGVDGAALVQKVARGGYARRAG